MFSRKFVGDFMRLRRVALVASIVIGLLFGVVGLPRTVVAQGQPERIDVLIAFHEAPGPQELAIVRGVGGTVHRTFTIVPAVAATIPARAAAALQNNPRIRAVELDGLFYADDAFDDELNNTWGVKRIGGGTVGAPAGGGLNARVAVIDSGVDCGHSELAAHCGGGWDFVNNDNDPDDDNSHGTHVAGTVAASRDGVGVVGVAPNAEIVPLKVLGASGSGSFSNVIAALNWLVNYNNANPSQKILVTNNSYGSSSDPGTTVRAAFDAALNAGIVHIASAGNSGICSAKTNTVGYPGRYTSVLAVAATNASDQRPCWSSTGPDVDISAPGVSINSTLYNGNGYAVFSGTSMASPHVAGVAALVFAAGATSANQVRSILTSTALDIGPGGKDNLYGYGLVQAAAAVAAVGSGGGGGGATESTVTAIDYSTSGGRDGTKNLQIAVTVQDDLGAAVAGAAVSISLARNGAFYGSATGTTNTSGVVTFTASNAPPGTYVTTVTGVVASGLTFDGVTPANSFTK